MTSLPEGSGQWSRLVGDSTWVMTNSASRRSSRAGIGECRRQERRAAGQPVVPGVLADGLEEQVERADPGLLHPVSAGLGHHVGEVAFQQRPVDVGERIDAGEGQEIAEADEGIDSGAGSADAQPGCQPEPGPPFAQITQPGWVMRSNRSRARGQGRPAGAATPGSLSSRHTSLGYSMSQPIPSRNVSTASRATSRNISD